MKGKAIRSMSSVRNFSWAGTGWSVDFTVSAATDRGSVREINEDGFVAEPPLFLVADGMGGYAFGDRASGAVVEATLELARRGSMVRPVDVLETIATAESAVRAIAGGEIAGTTLTGVAIVESDDGPAWMVFNIGDSRVYRLVDGRVTQISVDHSVVQELVEDGVISSREALEHPERNVVTRAVGVGDPIPPDVWILPAGGTERFLVCSDGLIKELDDLTIADILERSSLAPAESLVAAAVAAGGIDNVTVVVVDAHVIRPAATSEHLEATLPRT